MLTTHEDILPLSIRARDGGAYRGMNETTTVFQIIFDDASVIFLGDAEESNGEALIALYGKNLLSCKYLQGAHHLINDDRSIYANIRAEKLLAPQGRFTVMTRFCDNIRYLTSSLRDGNIYLRATAHMYSQLRTATNRFRISNRRAMSTTTADIKERVCSDEQVQ